MSESDILLQRRRARAEKSPMLPTLPDGWQARLVKVDFASGMSGWFLEPNDAAISKYVRGQARDFEWIRAGLGAGPPGLARGRRLERTLHLRRRLSGGRCQMPCQLSRGACPWPVARVDQHDGHWNRRPVGPKCEIIECARGRSGAIHQGHARAFGHQQAGRQ